MRPELERAISAHSTQLSIIRDAAHGNCRWEIETAFERVSARVEVDDAGVTFVFTLHTLTSSMRWMLLRDDDVVHVQQWVVPDIETPAEFTWRLSLKTVVASSR